MRATEVARKARGAESDPYLIPAWSVFFPFATFFCFRLFSICEKRKVRNQHKNGTPFLFIKVGKRPLLSRYSERSMTISMFMECNILRFHNSFVFMITGSFRVECVEQL